MTEQPDMNSTKAFTLDEVLATLESVTRPIQFANDNPHWWLGRIENGNLTYDYECCDLCNEEGNFDHEEFGSVEELRGSLHLNGFDKDAKEWRIATQGARVI